VNVPAKPSNLPLLKGMRARSLLLNHFFLPKGVAMLEQAAQHALVIIAQLNIEEMWGLSAETQWDYVQSVVGYLSDAVALSDALLRIMLRYYHTEHALVDALRDPGHPEHSEQWLEWTRQGVRILAAQLAGGYAAIGSLLSLEDLAQEAMHDLWRGLPSFRYQSRFYTWAYAVICHCLSRHYRALQAQKRNALVQIHSLESMLSIIDTLPDRATPTPDEAALEGSFAALLRQVLARHPDDRLVPIFQLWAYEERTLRVIGEQLHLSTARVHTLLGQAIALLRDETAIRDWLEHERAGAPPYCVPPARPGSGTLY
jgi:RNA polymerase sigma factor (sigma-70 family)